MSRKEWGIVLLLVPVVLAIMAFVMGSLVYVGLSIISMFALIGTLKVCHKRENIFLFLVTALSSLPINSVVLRKIYGDFLIIGQHRSLLFYLYLAQILIACVCIEEILIMLCGRILWPRQYKVMLPKITYYNN